MRLDRETELENHAIQAPIDPSRPALSASRAFPEVVGGVVVVVVVVVEGDVVVAPL